MSRRVESLTGKESSTRCAGFRSVLCKAGIMCKGDALSSDAAASNSSDAAASNAVFLSIDTRLRLRLLSEVGGRVVWSICAVAFFGRYNL